MTIFYGFMAAICIAGACSSGSCIVIAQREKDKARAALGVFPVVLGCYGALAYGALAYAALYVKEVLKNA